MLNRKKPKIIPKINLITFFVFNLSKSTIIITKIKPIPKNIKELRELIVAEKHNSGKKKIYLAFLFITKYKQKLAKIDWTIGAKVTILYANP